MADLICGAVSSTSSSRSDSFLFVFSHSEKDCDVRARAREQLRARQAAARLDELRGREVFVVHQQRWAPVRRRWRPGRAADQDARDAEFAGADRQLACRRVAPSAAARRDSGQTSPRPGMPLASVRRAEGFVRHHDLAAQRIARGHRAHRGELAGVAVEDHAEQAGLARDSRGRGAALRSMACSSMGCAGLQPQVRREHLARLVVDRDADAIDEEAHARERGHRDRDRQHQHAELARLPFAQQRAQRDGERVHARAHLSAPESICSTRPQRDGDRAIVRHQHQRGVRLRIEIEQQRDDAFAGVRVEIARWARPRTAPPVA